MTMTAIQPRLRLAIVDDYAVVVAGVASFLQAERIDVVETGATTSVISDVDIVLYDTFGQIQGEGIDLEDFVRGSGGAKVVVYSWNLKPELIEEALAGGASGYLSKVLTGPAVVAALERIKAGEIVVLAGDFESSADGSGDWPGREAGLSPREAEIIALITQGLSNQEIADRIYVSINSVKPTSARPTARSTSPSAPKPSSGASTTASDPTHCAPSIPPSSCVRQTGPNPVRRPRADHGALGHL